MSVLPTEFLRLGSSSSKTVLPLCTRVLGGLSGISPVLPDTCSGLLVSTVSLSLSSPLFSSSSSSVLSEEGFPTLEDPESEGEVQDSNQHNRRGVKNVSDYGCKFNTSMLWFYS